MGEKAHNPFVNRLMANRANREDQMTTRFKVTIRKLSTGADYHMTLFAKDQDKAMERAKELARMSDKITREKMLYLSCLGIAVYRVVSCVVDPDQTRPIG